MNQHYESQQDQAEDDLYQRMEVLIKTDPWRWQSIGAMLGLAGAILAPLLGATLDVITWFVNSQIVTSRLHALSIVLCALPIPLLLLGAHCLDLLEAKSTSPSAHARPQIVEAASGRGISPVIHLRGEHQS